MNYLKMFAGFVLMSCVVAVLLSCGEDSPVDSEEGGDVPSDTSGTSLWRQRIPQLSNYTDNPMNLDLELIASEGDSSYRIELNEDTEAGMKQQMYSNGLYSSQNDSIYLYGNECGALDTTADTVAALSDSVCSFVIALPEPENDTITIETASIEPVMYLFPLSSEEVDMIIQVIPELNLARQSP